MPRPVRMGAAATAAAPPTTTTTPREDEGGEESDVLAEPGSPVAQFPPRGESSTARARYNTQSRGDVGAGASSKRHSRMFNPLSLDLPPAPSSSSSSSVAGSTGTARRDKSRSAQSFVQAPRQDQLYAPPPPGATKTARGATVAQRPAYGERANSAPSVPKSGAFGIQGGLDEEDEDDEEDELDDDELVEIASGEDEDIAGDEFFQQYAAPGARPEPRTNETPAQSEDDEEDELGEGPLSPTSNTTRFRPDSVAEPLGSPLAPQPVSQPAPLVCVYAYSSSTRMNHSAPASHHAATHYYLWTPYG